MIDNVAVKYNKPKELNPLAIKGRHDLAWSAVKEYFEIRLDGMCELCGEVPDKISVHHKNGNGLDNSRENLMGICPSCHMKLHHHRGLLPDEY